MDKDEQETQKMINLEQKMYETNHLGYRDEVLRARAWNEEHDRQQAIKKQKQSD